MAGLTAAVELHRAGHAVLVVDKGRGVGGRLASRRIGEATCDHGAQFITGKEPRFAAALAEWAEAGVVEEWYRNRDDENPRWRGKPAMTAIAKHLGRDLNLVVGERLEALRGDADGWIGSGGGRDVVCAGAALLTPPVPQSLALLDAGGVSLPGDARAKLAAIEYEPCLAVMAVLDGPSGIPAPGGMAPAEGPMAWIADNQAKGVSRRPAVTIHATAAFSREHWDRDRKETGGMLLQAAAAWLSSRPTEFQVHGWLYSTPRRVAESRCLVLNQRPPLLMAGDAFGGPGIEGAALSGWAAAETLQSMDLDSA
ncbi:MAG: NAD(P)-binding protein [Candidatus Eisenbacteria bacterium]|nr:NAD(P)-binding protein [Candidatus Eisenbacteria bacterium]